MGRTLYDKLWDEHVVHTEEDGTTVLYIDRHLTHEVTKGADRRCCEYSRARNLHAVHDDTEREGAQAAYEEGGRSSHHQPRGGECKWIRKHTSAECCVDERE